MRQTSSATITTVLTEACDLQHGDYIVKPDVANGLVSGIYENPDGTIELYLFGHRDSAGRYARGYMLHVIENPQIEKFWKTGLLS
jgi:hypothetical protein